MSKTASLSIAICIIASTGYVVFFGLPFGGSSSQGGLNVEPSTQNTISNSEIKEGVQYITITAQGGYSPRKSSAQANLPTKLIVKTDNTYDCSAALVIRSLDYRNMLPSTGETIIDVGTPKVGETLQGVCSMGMYNFAVQFK
jgi:plastocyanin domain-containing protein